MEAADVQPALKLSGLQEVKASCFALGSTIRNRDSDHRRLWGRPEDASKAGELHSRVNMLPGRAKMSFRVPSMSTVAKVVGRLRDRNIEQREQRQRLRYQPSGVPAVLRVLRVPAVRNSFSYQKKHL